MHRQARRAVLRQRLHGGRSDEAGDTLVEVLISLVVIAIAGVALLAGLLTSAGASIAHRNTTNVDAVLASFAETANVDVAQQLAPGSPCVGTYPIAGSPLPSSAPAGAPVTVFAAGFAPGSPLTASLQPAAAPPWQVATTSSSGTATVTFALPAVAAGAYQLTLTDGAGNRAPPVSLTVQSASSPPPATPSYTGFTLTMTPSPVDPSAFVTPARAPCNLALAASDADPGHAASGRRTVVVAALSSLEIPTVTVTPPTTTIGVTSSVTLVATVAGLHGTPNGTITWTHLPAGTPAPNCTAPTVTLVTGSATCTVNGLQAGTSSPTAIYSGDANYTGGIGQASVTVNKLAPTLLVTASPAVQPAPGTLTFTATATGTVGTPTGTITWSGLPAGIAQSDCNNTTLSSTGTVTCTITQVPAVTNATVTAAYSGDPDYLPAAATSAPPATVAAATVTVAVAPSGPLPIGSTLTFTASVTGNSLTPTGTVTWSGLPAGAVQSGCANPTPVVSGSATCTITQAPAVANATVVATYSGDTTYPTASGSASVTVGPPAVTVTGTTSGNTVTFTADVTGAAAVPVTGTVTWAVSASDNSTPACSPANGPVPVNTGSAQVSCAVSGADNKLSYTATASYQPNGDPHYTAARATSSPVNG